MIAHRLLSWLLVSWLVLALAGCSDSKGKTEPAKDGGPAAPGAGAMDGGPEARPDGALPADASGQPRTDAALPPPQKSQPNIVSVGPPYTVAEDKYQYTPKSSEAETPQWKVKEGPTGMRVNEDKQVSWEPTKEQAGSHHVVIEGMAEDKVARQEYDVVVAVSEKRAEAVATPKDGGEAKVSSPTSKIQGASVKARPGAMKEEKTLTISELDKAPPMSNKNGELKSVEYGPSGQAFSQPALIALPLASDVLLSASRVGAFVYNPAGRWERVRTVGIDLERRFVYAQAEHFSLYAGAQSNLDVTVALERMHPASSCEDKLVGRAELSSPLSDMEASSINNSTPAIKALIEGGAADVEALLKSPSFAGSLRFMRVFELVVGQGADASVIEQRILVSTLYAPGDGTAAVRHTRASGELLAEFDFDNLADELATVSAHLRGAPTHALFNSVTTDPVAMAMRMHVVFSEQDTSLDPVSVDDLGMATVDVAALAPAQPRGAINFDADCDRLANSYDQIDNRQLASLTVSPEDVVTVFARSSVKLSAVAQNLGTPEDLTWSVISGVGTLSPVVGEEGARTFSASEPGRKQIEVSAPSNELSYVFVVDVLETPAVNTAPTCVPAAGSLVSKVGDSVGLTAVALDAESPNGALTVEWGMVDNSGASATLVDNGQIEVFGQSARFIPASAGEFSVGCRAWDGSTFGPVGQVALSVVAADKNRSPVDTFLSPPSATILVGESLTLSAHGTDPDGDDLTFTWSSSAGTLGSPSSDGTSSSISISSTGEALITVTVSISDGKGPATALTASVLVITNRNQLMAADADGDGFPAGTGAAFDCNDANAAVHPTAIDVCGNDLDEDCVGGARLDDCDDDGFTTQQGDCNDADAFVHPEAFELCNGVDDDCDQGTDEDYAQSLAGTCAVGVGACRSQGRPACAADGVNVVCAGEPGPSADETCDGIDQDCDGEIDEGLSCAAVDGGVDAGPACVPATEVCNGLDDDCDLSVDEDLLPTESACGVGACAATGESSCVDGKLVDSCEAALPEAPDTDCNNLDDDCDGRPDDNFPPASTACGQGACLRGGELSCVGGTVQDSCLPAQALDTTDPTCDNVDDDCNGVADEDYAAVDTRCGVGACAAVGRTFCEDGEERDDCTPGAPAALDTCDGIDNDCDGITDEDHVRSSTSCGLGVCAAGGTLECQDGQVVSSCLAGQGAASDTSCDDRDDDCDGTADEDYASVASSCGVGACAATGVTSCVDGAVVSSCVIGASTGTDNDCDNLDDDCDGAVDEAYAPTVTSCGLGVCTASGATSCVAGNVVDSCVLGTTTGLDDDCDALDDDCDGSVDEAYAPVATSCGVGVCMASGATSCVNGNVLNSCTVGASTGTDNDCDNLDDDCDGSTDEAYAPTVTSCGLGVCTASGATSCVAGNVVDSCVLGATTGLDDDCDALDDDCDGSTDEAYAPVATSCGIGACMAAGATSCINGNVVNNCTPGAAAGSDPTCDGVDNDCNGLTDDLPPSACETALPGSCATGHYACNGTEQVCEPDAAALPDLCNAIDDNCTGTVDEGSACNVVPLTNSLVGVWFECVTAACDVLDSHGLMFLDQASPNAGYDDAFSLKTFGETAYSPVEPYCGDGRFDWRSEEDGDGNPATDILTVRWTEGNPAAPPCAGDVDCSVGSVCHDGRCAAACTLDADCAAGESCFVGGCSVVSTSIGNLVHTDLNRATVTWTSLPPASDMPPVMDLLRVPENSGGQCPQGGGTGCGCNLQPGFCEEGCGCDADCGQVECQPNETCGNQTNDDCDSYVNDGDDPDCQPSCAQDPNQPVCSDAGETCLNAIDISAGGMFGGTVGARNDGIGNCGGGFYTDRVYYFDVGAGGVEVTLGLSSTASPNLTFSVVAAPPGWEPAQNCPAASGAQNPCFYGNQALHDYLPGGRYLVYVQGAPAGTPFTLRLGKRFNGTCNPPLGLTGDTDGVSICDGDCDDNSSSTHPGAADTCNGIDDNCNGYVDDLSGTCETGLPGVCAVGTPTCDAQQPCMPIQAASAEDYCGDGADNDCDGTVDEAGCVTDAGEACTNAIAVGTGGTFGGSLADATNDAVSGCGFGGAEIFYAFSIASRSTELIFNTNPSPNQAARYVLYGDCGMQALSCGMPNRQYLEPGNYLLAVEHDGSQNDPSYEFAIGFSNDGVCETPDGDNDGESICQGDCNDTNPGVNHGASEGTACDNLDNDCNGQVDDLGTACSVPDATGVCAEGSMRCNQGAPSCVANNQPDRLGRDVCGDGLDNDCDGSSDGDDLQSCVTLAAGDVCSLAVDVSLGGVFNDTLTGYGDDTDAGCGDGTGIGGGVERFYRLTLSERRRVQFHAMSENQAEPMSIALHTSCAGNNPSSFCGGEYVDQELAAGTYFFAVSAQVPTNYSLSVSTRLPGDYQGSSCVPGDTDLDTFNLCTGDCAEGNADVYPGAPELCNGLDDNCNGAVDDGTPSTGCTVEGGVGECALGHTVCTEGTTQCGALHTPGQDPEVCGDGRDNDCDGITDEEGCAQPNGETCALAVPLPLAGPYVSGSMTGATDDAPGCIRSGSPDKFYRFNIAAPTTLYLHVKPVGPAPASGFLTAVYRGECGGPGEPLGCFAAGVTSLSLDQPGSYYLVVESTEGAGFEVQLATSNGEGCSSNDRDGDGNSLCNFDCDDSDAKAFQGNAETCDQVDNNCDGSIDNVPSNACSTGLLGICADGVTACSAAGAPICQQLAPARPTDICDDLLDNDCDGQSDEPDCEPLPAGETCELAIDATGGGAFDGSLVGATDEHNGCGPQGAAERFYEFTLAVPASVYLDVEARGNPGPDPLQFYTGIIYSSCGAPTSYGCGTPDIDGWQLDAGTYRIAVEANRPVDYTLHLAFFDGELCSANGGLGNADFDNDGFSLCDNDCNESSAAINPDGLEICNNGIDDDCDGYVDYVPPVACTSGQLGDCAAGTTQCPQVGAAPVCVPAVQPATRPELCDDGIDNDCDGPDDDASACVPATGASCDLGIDITNDADGVILGSITDPVDDAPGCGTTAAEMVYRFTASVSGYVFVGAAASAGAGAGEFNVRTSDGDCFGPSYCQGPGGVNHRPVVAGQTVFVTVEGPLNVPFQLSIANRPGQTPYAGPCFDGLTGSGVGDADLDGVSLCDNDCNEANPDVHAGADEICGDQVDDNCDGTLTADGISCDTGLLGMCSNGRTQCTASGEPPSCDPYNAPIAESCNAADDDCDGQTDEDNVCGCVPQGPEQCTNAIDDDCDNLIDGADPECQGGACGCDNHIAGNCAPDPVAGGPCVCDPDCGGGGGGGGPGNTCATAEPIGPGPRTGSLTGYTDDVQSACFGPGLIDHFYVINVPSGQGIDVQLTGAPAGSGWALYGGSCGALTPIRCGPGMSQGLAAGTYYIAVEGPASGGNYDMNVFVGFP